MPSSRSSRRLERVALLVADRVLAAVDRQVDGGAASTGTFQMSHASLSSTVLAVARPADALTGGFTLL
jgi:hypothetical protein